MFDYQRFVRCAADVQLYVAQGDTSVDHNGAETSRVDYRLICRNNFRQQTVLLSYTGRSTQMEIQAPAGDQRMTTLLGRRSQDAFSWHI